jgi:mannose-6-phosphate isomerase-like protein (cupin superfamily)
MKRNPEETKAIVECVFPIEYQSLQNTYFRQVLLTAQHSQLAVMCLRPGEEMGDELHSNVDVFFRIEQGEAEFVFNEKEERTVHRGDLVLVPAETYYKVVNTSKTEMLKFYAIYCPLNYPDGTLHKTIADAKARRLRVSFSHWS